MQKGRKGKSPQWSAHHRQNCSTQSLMLFARSCSAASKCAFVEGMFLVQTRAEHYIVSSRAFEHGGKEYILQHQEN